MEITDLNVLQRDPNQNNLYDLTEITFEYVTSAQKSTVVEMEQEMRIDLVCNTLYSSVDYVDFLCNFNDIDNPLNIMEGDIINYLSVDTISSTQVQSTLPSTTRTTLINANKKSKVDPNRQQYVDNNYSLPPTFTQTPSEPVKIVGNNMIIGGQ